MSNKLIIPVEGKQCLEIRVLGSGLFDPVNALIVEETDGLVMIKPVGDCQWNLAKQRLLDEAGGCFAFSRANGDLIAFAGFAGLFRFLSTRDLIALGHSAYAIPKERALVVQSVEWTGWEVDGQKCPRCGSKNIEGIDDSADATIVGHMHCKTCSFNGKPFIY